ncbi:MAG: hypothetical protein JWL77_4018 [Chthonomonadaceae bacterium]|nr:hypothetical protein [Chthonomonadaceae bacterium]
MLLVYQDAMDNEMTMLAEQFRQAGLTDMEVLEEFVVYNAELEQLEEKLRQFNIFEAIGMQNQEIRHSTFLAFLLDPQQTHGLGEDFLKKVLQRALLSANSASLPVNVVNLHLMNLTKTVIMREWSNIDVLLLNADHRLAVIIENKLQSGEHDDQLDRYFETVQRQHMDWRIIALYLTIDGSKPSHSHYLPISFTDIAGILESLVDSRETVLGPDVRTLMHHYVQMLRRNIVSDAELENLCQKIYQKHKRALDLIISRIPDKATQIIDYCKTIVEGYDELKIRYSVKRMVGFHPVEWDVRALQFHPPETSPKLALEFYFFYDADGSLRLALFLQPKRPNTYTKLWTMAQKHPKLFKGTGAAPAKNHSAKRIYSKRILAAKDIAEVDLSMIHSTISVQFGQFMNGDYLQIKQIVTETEWIWDANAPYASEGSGESETGMLEEEDL